MIKIVHLQYNTSINGDFATRLHREFVALGFESSILSLFSEGVDNNQFKSLGKKERLLALLDTKIQAYLMRNIIPSYGGFSYPVLGTDLSDNEQIRKADIIYVHWALGGFLNLSGMESLIKMKKPVVFVLHDMWPITGGCHHSFTCEKFKTTCFNCQSFPQDKKRDLSTTEFNKKFRLYNRYDNIFFVAPSRWMFEQAKESGLTRNKPVFHIPNVLDRKVFRPLEKTAAKEILAIPADHQVITFGANAIDSPFKGWDYLKQALEIFYQAEKSRQITILIFGGNNQKLAHNIPFSSRFLPHLKDEFSMPVVYNASDVFMAPSMADNLPYTVFEALACGAPVVAFSVGGIPDLIRHRENGYLARYKDAEDLAEGIRFCLSNRINGGVPSQLDNAVTMQKHLDLIRQIIPERKAELIALPEKNHS